MFDSWNRSRKHRQNGTLETWLANRTWLDNQRKPGEARSGPRVDTAGHGSDRLDPGSPPTLPGTDTGTERSTRED